VTERDWAVIAGVLLLLALIVAGFVLLLALLLAR
jgi:hypothetical protein